MKKFKTTVLLLVLAAFLSVSLFSCYGNFTLTRKLYEWKVRWVTNTSTT